MSEPLKYMYNPQFFERLCPVLKAVIPQFEERKFVHRVFDTTWPDLELKQRTRQVTNALHNFLPGDFPRAMEMVVSISHLLRKNKEHEHMYPFIFLPEYIELYGINHFELSMKAIEESTKLVSAEFAIRPFITRYPEETMKYMLSWSRHPEASVRRLSSEGCRPRLPWAMGLPDFKIDPSPILPILENLKADPSAYVRRSVANNLNDIAKDHPELALQIAKKWIGKNPATDWIVKHGCRTLLKRGNEAVLDLHGFNPHAKAGIRELHTTEKVLIGAHADFSFVFVNRENIQAVFDLNMPSVTKPYRVKYPKRFLKLQRIHLNLLYPINSNENNLLGI